MHGSPRADDIVQPTRLRARRDPGALFPVPDVFPRHASVPDRDHRRVAAYLAGDRHVFREIDSWIRREILKRFSSLRNEQEDLNQSVHWRLVVKLRQGAFGHRSTLRSYVSGITYHVAVDRLRETYRDRTVPSDKDPDDVRSTETPYLSLSPAEASRLLDQVVEQAQPSFRELWRMVFLERMTYAEAGRQLSIPPGTVKSRVWHGRRRALALVNERF